jgi:hypothetical protein
MWCGMKDEWTRDGYGEMNVIRGCGGGGGGGGG